MTPASPIVGLSIAGLLASAFLLGLAIGWAWRRREDEHLVTERIRRRYL